MKWFSAVTQPMPDLVSHGVRRRARMTAGVAVILSIVAFGGLVTEPTRMAGFWLAVLGCAVAGYPLARSRSPIFGGVLVVAACLVFPYFGILVDSVQTSVQAELIWLVTGVMLAAACLPLRGMIVALGLIWLSELIVLGTDPHIGWTMAMYVAGLLLPVMGIAGVMTWTVERSEAELTLAETAARQQTLMLALTNARLEQTREQLVQSGKLVAVGRLSAAIAHEINNPLTVILGAGVMLTRELQDQEHAELAGEIVEAGQRCRRITGALLRFGQPGRGRPEAMDLNGVISATVDLVHNHLALQGVRLHTVVAGPLPIRGDREQLQQVLLGILANAWQAIDGDGSIRLLAGRAKNEVFLSVIDDGHGIAPEHLSRLFEPFFTTRHQGERIGLGLSVAHRIITDHGGTISVESAPGEGARFTIRLPLLET